MEFFLIFLLFLILWIFFGWRKRKSEVKSYSVFPGYWREILVKDVPFYRQLTTTEKEQFEKRILHFLNTTQITGVKTIVDDTDKILVASSAIIPVFPFPEWEYINLNEVLLYPGAFDENFNFGKRESRILGMVGTGYMNGKMILSKQALDLGFKNETDKKNVGIHEFVHLIDKADGTVDGVPELLLKKQYTLPWLDLVKKTMEEIHSLKSDINPYGGVAESEFLPVIAEYFFERPKLLDRKHPELYALLSEMFTVDLSGKYKNYKPAGKTMRNDPCPCGSGKKYKNCCLRKAI